jgi:hypothetical protein
VQLLVSMTFVDDYMPEFLRPRQEGFALAIFTTAVRATPFKNRLEKYAQELAGKKFK